ncbi:MAG: PfkB family carbohydrate kinase [Proteobacteria bacterium]|nr:PfkB family carbohydrate kinase [Pseudomonadota bacterium]
MSNPFDVCVVGHVTRDRIVIGDRMRDQAGGAAYYASVALRRLGRRVAVVTKVAPEDAVYGLSELEAERIDAWCMDSAATTRFENIYPDGNLGRRIQRVTSVADPFFAADLGAVQARFFHLGPLTKRDMPLGFLQAASVRGNVSLDAQGLVRSVHGHEVKTTAWCEMEQGLRFVGVLKVNLEEARFLTGEHDPEKAARRLGRLVGRAPHETLVTLGRRGSLVYSADRLYHIPAARPSEVVDVTGCGDTFFAAYLHYRLGSTDAEQCGRFASVAATLALEHFGPFRATQQALEATAHSSSWLPAP